jgi:hypothetical protein
MRSFIAHRRTIERAYKGAAVGLEPTLFWRGVLPYFVTGEARRRTLNRALVNASTWTVWREGQRSDVALGRQRGDRVAISGSDAVIVGVVR